MQHTDRHLTVFPIEQLEAFDVLWLYVLRQGFPLQIDVRELWERSRCVWDTHTHTEVSHTVQTTTTQIPFTRSLPTLMLANIGSV